MTTVLALATLGTKRDKRAHACYRLHQDGADVAVVDAVRIVAGAAR